MSQDDGRVALVSGGSHGIGATTVRRLAARGWDISFCYRDDGPSVRQIEKDASELGVRVVAIQADVTDPAQVASWFRRAEDELGPIAAMVSCAGITRDLPLSLMAEDDWRAVIDTGLDGVFHLCRGAMFAMMKRRSGRIVAVTSVCGAYDHSGRGRDILARPGIAGFVRALAGQTARFGVSVNAVIPGLVAHDMADLVPERARGDLTETIAIRRFGDAAAVADLVAFLLSEKAAGITGTVLEARSVISLLTAVTPGRRVRRNGTCRGPKAGGQRARRPRRARRASGRCSPRPAAHGGRSAARGCGGRYPQGRTGPADCTLVTGIPSATSATRHVLTYTHGCGSLPDRGVLPKSHNHLIGSSHRLVIEVTYRCDILLKVTIALLRSVGVSPRPTAPRELGIDYVGICCCAGSHHARAMAEALGRDVPASKYSPSMDLQRMFRGPRRGQGRGLPAHLDRLTNWPAASRSRTRCGGNPGWIRRCSGTTEATSC